MAVGHRLVRGVEGVCAMAWSLAAKAGSGEAGGAWHRAHPLPRPAGDRTKLGAAGRRRGQLSCRCAPGNDATPAISARCHACQLCPLPCP